MRQADAQQEPRCSQHWFETGWCQRATSVHFTTSVIATPRAFVKRSHLSFFLPDVEYLTDPEGLVGYLEEKVKLGHICLYCNGKGKTFHSYRALQQVCTLT